MSDGAAKERPLLWALLALAVGVGAVVLSRVFVGTTPPLSFDLGPELAARLGTPEDRELLIVRPDFVWMAPLALLPWLLVSLRSSLLDVGRAQLVLQVLARSAAIVSAGIALAQPTLRAPIRGASVVFVVDVSESIDDEQLDQAQTIVREALAHAHAQRETISEVEDRTRVHLVTYAERARVIPLHELAPADLVIDRPQEGLLASDHGAGLRLAAALLDRQTEGRVVLITDAAGSTAERETLRRVAASLVEHGVSLHVRTFTPRVRGDVVVEDLHLPDEIRVGETFEIAVDVRAPDDFGEPVRTRLHLSQNGAPNALAPWVDIDVVSGKSQHKLPVRVNEPGPTLFSASLDATPIPSEFNRTTDNDAAAVVADAKGRPRVLLIGEDSTHALARALRADNLHVDERSAGALPTTLEELAEVDLVVFNDVPARSVSRPAQEVLVAWVREQGGGFIMVGGENSFGVGGWKGTLLSGILPVDFEGERQREQPTLALALVIDKSGSMSAEDRLDLVKEAARATARALDPSDEIAVIAFDSKPTVLVRLQKASSRFRISSDIRRLSAGGGTNALPALREAYLQLVGSKAIVKHVILLSDGQSPEQGINALLNDMRDSDMTVSAVGVGAGAGKDFLARVAQRGRGRYYFSQDGTDVPRIFSRETKEALKNAVVERELYPRVAKPVQALRGIDFDRAPGLRGIVPVKPKAQTETLLKTQHGEALLVRGRRGLGKTLAFASDAKPRWAASWMGWPGFPKLWSQLARDTMRQGKGALGGATVLVRDDGVAGRFRVLVDVEAPDGFANDLDGHVVVLDPARTLDDPLREQKVPLALTAPGRYEGIVDDVKLGQRLLRARLYDREDGAPRLAAEATQSVSIPYPTERSPAALAPDPGGLAALVSPGASSSGEVRPVIDEPGKVEGRTRARPIWSWVLAFLLAPLLVLDLMARRITFRARATDM